MHEEKTLYKNIGPWSHTLSQWNAFLIYYNNFGTSCSSSVPDKGRNIKRKAQGESRSNEEEIKECVKYSCKSSSLNLVVETQARAFKAVATDSEWYETWAQLRALPQGSRVHKRWLYSHDLNCCSPLGAQTVLKRNCHCWFCFPSAYSIEQLLL